MRSPQLQRLQAQREQNIAIMVKWSWKKSDRNMDLINRQIVWAYEQRNDHARAILDEYWNQLFTARYRKLNIDCGLPLDDGICFNNQTRVSK